LVSFAVHYSNSKEAHTGLHSLKIAAERSVAANPKPEPRPMNALISLLLTATLAAYVVTESDLSATHTAGLSILSQTQARLF